jgi:hypothetical protein
MEHAEELINKQLYKSSLKLKPSRPLHFDNIHPFNYDELTSSCYVCHDYHYLPGTSSFLQMMMGTSSFLQMMMMICAYRGVYLGSLMDCETSHNYT